MKNRQINTRASQHTLKTQLKTSLIVCASFLLRCVVLSRISEWKRPVFHYSTKKVQIVNGCYYYFALHAKGLIVYICSFHDHIYAHHHLLFLSTRKNYIYQPVIIIVIIIILLLLQNDDYHYVCLSFSDCQNEGFLYGLVIYTRVQHSNSFLCTASQAITNHSKIVSVLYMSTTCTCLPWATTTVTTSSLLTFTTTLIFIF